MTPRKLRPEEKIARALRDLDLDELKQETTKTDSILIRVSADEKSEIRTIAEVLEISVTEYLLGLHRQAVVHVRRPRSSE